LAISTGNIAARSGNRATTGMSVGGRTGAGHTRAGHTITTRTRLMPITTTAIDAGIATATTGETLTVVAR